MAMSREGIRVAGRMQAQRRRIQANPSGISTASAYRQTINTFYSILHTIELMVKRYTSIWGSKMLPDF